MVTQNHFVIPTTDLEKFIFPQEGVPNSPGSDCPAACSDLFTIAHRVFPPEKETSGGTLDNHREEVGRF